MGLVCDAIFTDFDNDGWPDLVFAGEWMPVTFLKNDKGIFKNVLLNQALANQIGWWNTIAAGDFDNDGDIDYIVGNLGQNSFYRQVINILYQYMQKILITMAATMPFLSLYLPASQDDIRKKNFLHTQG